MGNRRMHVRGAKQTLREYREQNTIRAIWLDVFHSSFGCDLEEDLKETVSRRIGRFGYNQSSRALRNENDFRGSDIFLDFTNGTRNQVDISKYPRPIKVLAMYAGNNNYTQKDGKVYFPASAH